MSAAAVPRCPSAARNGSSMNRLPQGLLRTAAVLAVAAAALAPAVHAAPVAERLVVRFHGALPDGVAPRGAYLGARVLAVDPVLAFAAVQAPDGAAFRAQARGHAEVRAVEADPVLPLAAFTPNDPEFAVSQYGPQAIGAPAAWNVTLGSTAVTACVVDTGIRTTHQEFAGRYAGGIDLVNGDSDPTDDNGHGTHVAGILGAGTDNGAGIAGLAQVSLKAAKVLDATGAGAMSTVASGIRWCADNGANVINLSLGSTTPSTVLQDAVDYAWSKGAVLVAASGNGGCSGCVQYPAAYTNTIAVGCVDPTLAVCSWTSQGPEVDLAAPGSSIQSTWWTSDTATMRAAGTSMSAAHVSGAAALVWSAHPGWTNVQVRKALESTAQDVGAAGPDAATGHGLVRVDLALAANVSAPAPPPPAPTQGVSWSPASQAASVAARGTVTFTFVVRNTGSATDTFTLVRSAPKTGWTATLSASSVTLTAGAAANVQLTVSAAKTGNLAETITATSQANAAVSAAATATANVAK